MIIFDLIGSILSTALSFDYTWLAIGSLIIYATVGVLASKTTFVFGPVAAGIVGLVDSTAGWYFSWLIGPGRVEGITPPMIFATVAFVTVEAAFFGIVAAAVARALKRR